MTALQDQFNAQYDAFGNLLPSANASASQTLPPPDGLLSNPVSQPTAPSSLLSGTTVASLNVDSQGNIRSGQSAYNTGMGWWIGNDAGTPKLSIGDGGVSHFLTWDGANLVINGYLVAAKGTFGGRGADGALNISSGTTTIDLGSASVVVKEYTSISITGTGALAFINPASAGTIVILKSQGDVTITSSASPCVDLRGIGAATDTSGLSIIDGSNHYGGTGGDGSGGSAGSSGSAGSILTLTPLYTTVFGNISRRDTVLACGSGGGTGGKGARTSGGTVAGGAGGRGGGALMIECAGAWNYTSTGGIDISGHDGSTGGTASDGSGGGGGGGGCAGMAIIMYKTLTANSGTIIAKGGVGGSGGDGATSTGGTAQGGGGGGGGAGSHVGAGATGGTGGVGANGSGGSSNSSAGAGSGGGGGGGNRTGIGAAFTGGSGGTVASSATTSYLVTENIVFG